MTTNTPKEPPAPTLSDAERPRRLSRMAESRKANKIKPIFYTVEHGQGRAVALWHNTTQSANAPLFDGAIDGRAVALWPRQGSAGNFLSVHKGVAGPGGKYAFLGRANVVVNSRGMLRFAIDLDGLADTIWASVSREAPQELLVLCGLRPELIERRKAQFLDQKETVQLLPPAPPDAVKP